MDEEVDPLDAYMAGIKSTAMAPSGRSCAGERPQQCDEQEDHAASFLEEVERREAADEGSSGDEVGGLRRQLKDQKGKQKGRQLELLAPLDHNAIVYAPIRKNFYEEHPSVKAMSEAAVGDVRRRLNVRCSGFDVPRPIRRFDEAGLGAELDGAIRRCGYEAPTPIQCAALPVALSGRDLIGIAATGSGKTASYMLPMLRHVSGQLPLEEVKGPIGLVIAPTHELAEQIVREGRRLAKPLGLRVAALIGGVGKFDQMKELRAGAEVVVGTPGRLMEMVAQAKGGLHMGSCSLVVIDEADRMFSLGFEPQIRSLLGQVRPDRQTLLFSATFRPNLERLARDSLTEPVRVTIGEAGDANEDVSQIVEILRFADDKWRWLSQRLNHFTSLGSVLIFVSTKMAAEDLARQLSAFTRSRVDAIHGDKTQHERAEALARFKRDVNAGGSAVLVATDVASRGLDIPSIKTVVCYETTKRVEDHTHRIGRTGRAGAEDGTAYSLLTRAEEDAAVDLVGSLLSAQQAPAEDLLALARRSRRWASSGMQRRLEARVEGTGNFRLADGGVGHSGSSKQLHALAPTHRASHANSGAAREFAPPQQLYAPPQPSQPSQQLATPTTFLASPPSVAFATPQQESISAAAAEARAKAQAIAAQLSARTTAFQSTCEGGPTDLLNAAQPQQSVAMAQPPESSCGRRRPSRWS